MAGAVLEQEEVLSTLLDAVAAEPGSVVLFDIDDTLLSTVERHRRILAEFASEPEVMARWPESSHILSQLPAARVRYLITDTAREAGCEAPELLGKLREFWFSRFFKNEYLEADEALPGAAQYCRRVAAKGGIVVYLTGRDEGMRAGTERSLSRLGFPAIDGRQVRLVLKPSFDTPDLDYKMEALSNVEVMGPVAGGFENEPAHANLMAARFPGARMVLVETRHSPKPVPLSPEVLRIRDFVLA